MMPKSNNHSKVKQRHILMIYPGDANILFDANARDNCVEPFILLREECGKLGYLVEAADRQALQDCAWLLFLDARSVTYGTGIKGFLRRLRFVPRGRTRNWLGEAQRAEMTNQLALFLFEPPSVYPENREISIYSQFPTVFSWNDDLVDGIHIHKFYLPIPVRVPRVEKVNFSNKKLLVNITSNKFSRYPGELYSARRDAILYFEKATPNDFDLYGAGWDAHGVNVRSKWRFPNPNRTSTPYSSYRGNPKHKGDILPRYRFAICYENASDQPGLITEKIFDCMRADCVPIYWGAPNVTEYVDPAAFVDRRNFKSNQELKDYITGINEKQYEQFREAIATYLASERFSLFLAPAFVQKVTQVLGLNHSN